MRHGLVLGESLFFLGDEVVEAVGGNGKGDDEANGAGVPGLHGNRGEDKPRGDKESKCDEYFHG